MSTKEKSLAELIKEKQEQKSSQMKEKKKSIEKDEETIESIFGEDEYINEGKGVFTIRFLGYVAAEMGIINYGSITRVQLMLKIGKRYIEKSGFVK